MAMVQTRSGAYNLRELKDIPHYEPGRPPRPLFDISFMEELEPMWGRKWGAQSALGKIHVIMVSKPSREEFAPEFLEFRSQDPAFFGAVRGEPDPILMQSQYDYFLSILRGEGIEVLELNLPPVPLGLYVTPVTGIHGPGDCVMLNGGVIIPRLSIATKRGCEVYWTKRFAELGSPILYTVHGYGVFEGGNVAWLDPRHVMIGVGLRCNDEGLRQVDPIFRMAGVEEIHPVHLTSYVERSIGNQHHLRSVFSMVAERLCVLYPPRMDHSTIEYLRSKKIKLIEAPEREMLNAACNILSLRPGKVLMTAGNPVVASALRAEGLEVLEMEWTEKVKQGGGAQGGGGPICSSMSLVREPGPML
ncbi:MAG: hypothetical protein HYU86_04795 [Chloroflexi bacterium]|nr:hypothetical protein [Chloroflexota bacterium]